MEINSVGTDPFVDTIDDSREEEKVSESIKNVAGQAISSQPCVEKPLQERHIVHNPAVASNPGSLSSVDLLEAGVSETKHEEPTRTGLKEEIGKSLDDLSFCYVTGIGSLGKPCIAEGLEKNDEYLTVLSISLESPASKRAFLEHAGKALKDNERASEADVLDKYFTLLYRATQLQENKKVLIIIDDVETPDDIKTLKNIYEILRRFQSPEKDSPFDLLVRGRLDRLTANELSDKNMVVELKRYANEEITWQLFLGIFLAKSTSDRFKGDLEARKGKLLEIFKKYGYHTGFTAVLAQLFATSCKERSIDATVELVSELTEAAVGNGDYEALSKVLNIPLDFLDREYGEKARDLFHILALMSNGHIRYKLLKPILEKYCEEKKISMSVLVRILSEFESLGLIQPLGEEAPLSVFSMPKFYNAIMRYNLAKLYNENGAARDRIDSIITLIFKEVTAVLDSPLPQPQEYIDDSIMYLLSLCDYVNKVEGAKKAHGSISKKAIQYIAAR